MARSHILQFALKLITLKILTYFVFSKELVSHASRQLEFFNSSLSNRVLVFNTGDEFFAQQRNAHAVDEEGIEEVNNFRLCKYVIPTHYQIHLFPNFADHSFIGTVSIDILLLEAQDHLRLHLKDIDITETSLVDWEGRFIPVNGFANPKHDYWIIKPVSFILCGFLAGHYQLSFKYRGRISNDLNGFYSSFYTDPRDKLDKFVVSTQFQATYGRRAFPCFDEPGFKSTFSVSVVKPSSLVALGNMPIALELPDTPWNGITTVIFDHSLPMPTYLVALAVGDFAHLQSWSGRGLPLRIYTTPSQIQRAEYTASIMPKILDYFEEYFGIPYPLPKLDLVGIPDYEIGGMENWGLITFREDCLLFQPGVGSASDKQRVTTIVAHELAHMWFGNLVTPVFWNDIWLNEGLANYFQFKGAAAVHPDWDIENEFVVNTLMPTLGFDGKLSSPSILRQKGVETTAQISELFDHVVTYKKGASIIRMLENFMGSTQFWAGISNYLVKYSFVNVETQDLWESLQQFSGNKNISQIMETWTRQPGYPIVILEQRRNDGAWILKQERFLSNRDSGSGVREGYRWEIPVGIQWALGNLYTKNKRIIWMHQHSDHVVLPAHPTSLWVKLNVGQFGYYRVLYPVEMYKIFRILISSIFTPVERCGLIDDAFSFSSADYLSYFVTLDLSLFLATELHYIPWACAAAQFSALGGLVKAFDPETHVLYQKYVLALISNIYQRLKWSDNDNVHHQTRLLKPLIFSLACENGHPSCLSRTKSLFSRWIKDPGNRDKQIPASLRTVVYNWGIYQSNVNSWERLLKIYIKEDDAHEKVTILRALTYIQDKAILNKFLQLAKDESLVKRQDYLYFLEYFSETPLASEVIWDFYRAEYPYLVERFNIDNRFLGSIIIKITSGFATTKKLQEVQDLFAQYPEGGAGTEARKISMESIQEKISWGRKDYTTKIRFWLEKTIHFPN